MVDLESILRAIDRDGFHVLSSVISEGEVCEIGLQVVRAQADFQAISNPERANAVPRTQDLCAGRAQYASGD